MSWQSVGKYLKKSGAGALLLCLTMWLAAAPVWAYSAAYPQARQIGEGTFYYDVVAENGQGVQRAHYIEYTPNESVVPVVAYGQGFYGRSTVTYVGQYLSGLGEQPIAAVNADFFNLSTGVPIGIVIKEGTLITSAGGAYAVGFAADGSAFGGKPQLMMMLQGDSGSVRVENLNKTRSSYTVNLYDHNWGAETRINSPGTNVLLEKIDDIDPYIGCSIRMRVVDICETALSTPIAANQMVLTVAATGEVTKVGVFEEGEEVTLTITADDERWAQAAYAVGGKALLAGGQPDVADIPTKGSSARSAVGFRADGTVVFFVNDGKQAGYSVGLTPQALAEEMLALGIEDAIALDGGGSTCLAVRPGGGSLAAVNSPSDGTLRKCANYIFLLNRHKGDGDAAYMGVESESRFVLAGAAVGVTATMYDAAGQPLGQDGYAADAAADGDKPGDGIGNIAVDWSVGGGMGQVKDGYFIAGDEGGTAVITAKAGQIAARQNIYVLKSVSNLQVLRGGRAVSELQIVPGDKIQLDAAGLYKGETVALDNAAVEWQLVGDIGNIDGEGYYHAGGSDMSGSIIVSCGSARAELPVVQLIGGEAPAIVGVTLPTALASGESGTFSFRVTAGMGSYYLLEDQIELLLDGKPVEYRYAYSSGVLTAELSDLADGMHRLTVIATDDDGKMARKSLTFRVGTAAAAAGYADVPDGHWAAEYIGYLAERGLMQGEMTGGELTFNPGRNLTRAEFAVVAARYLELPEPEGIYLPFADSHHIPEWAKDSVKAIYAAGIMGGEDVKGKLFFYPRNNISRQEAMAVISRILGDGYPAAAQSFADGEQISGWAAEHIDRLVTLGLVGGYEDGTIRPLESITRAEIAKVLCGMY
ncbi:MAG: S-layer homology domain-containing protein [Firmicutes bacterium]|nr:S-layer homology domain-containing protein [Bacillota bacterium]